MTRLIIQIPCLNEAESLPATLAELPRQIPGVDEVVVLVIDDGSVDDTAEVALRSGADHVVRHKTRQGVARAFVTGLRAALDLGADLVVNTDADNQYPGRYIPALVEPLLRGEADMVVGDRQVNGLAHFSRSKRVLQRLGSWVVRRASGTEVPDTTSGFRAYNRDAALSLEVVSSFTYTLESLIQAGKMSVAVTDVPVGANEVDRPSRLFPSTWNYVRRNALAVFRAYAMYEPLRVFTAAAIVLAIAALAAWTPFLADWIVNGDSNGHVQSLIAGAVLSIAAVQMFALGVIGDALAGQRVMTQRALERVRRVELALGVEPPRHERVGAAGAEAGISNERGERVATPAGRPE